MGPTPSWITTNGFIDNSPNGLSRKNDIFPELIYSLIHRLTSMEQHTSYFTPGTKRSWEGIPIHSETSKPQPPPAPTMAESSPNVLSMFETFRDELDQHHDRRERLIKASRDITALSKKMCVSFYMDILMPRKGKLTNTLETVSSPFNGPSRIPFSLFLFLSIHSPNKPHF
jgi:hypothetical protein